MPSSRTVLEEFHPRGPGSRANIPSGAARRSDGLLRPGEWSTGAASDKPRWRTLPARTTSAMAPTVSSIGTCGSTRCWYKRSMTSVFQPGKAGIAGLPDILRRPRARRGIRPGSASIHCRIWSQARRGRAVRQSLCRQGPRCDRSRTYPLCRENCRLNPGSDGSRESIPRRPSGWGRRIRSCPCSPGPAWKPAGRPSPSWWILHSWKAPANARRHTRASAAPLSSGRVLAQSAVDAVTALKDSRTLRSAVAGLLNLIRVGPFQPRRRERHDADVH